MASGAQNILRQKAREELHAKYEGALTRAYEAANRAQVGMVENPRALDCGFAWCVSNDLSFNRWCRERNASTGSKHYGSKNYPSGWSFWCPGNFNGQAVSIHEAGAKAFSETLQRELGTSLVSWSSRLD